MSTKNNTPENTEEEYQGILGDYTEAPAETNDSPAAAQQDNAEAPQKKKASKKKIITIVGISAASVALVGCLGFAGVGLINKQKNSVAASSENYKISTQVMTCYYQDILTSFIDYYGADTLLSTYGLDVSQPLSEQTYPYDETMTWYDLVMQQAESTVTQELVICEAADAEGFTLSDEELQEIEDTIAETDISSYGNGVKESDLRKMLEIQALSTAYYTYITDNLTVSDDEIEAYYEANESDYLTCGLVGFSVSYSTGDDDTDADTDTDSMTQEDAEALANLLKNAKTSDEFENIVADILVEYEDYTQDDLDSLLPTIYNDSYSYSEGSELSEWAFGDGCSVGDTYMIEGTGVYYVYMLTSEPARDESSTVNVRHILFMTGDDNMQAAEDALAEWESGDRTEESFAELAEKYSEDTGSNTNGGLYENVYEGQMVTAFNDWCFDESRQPGDTGIVETSYGVHVMYFSGLADPKWKADVIDTLKSDSYTEWYTEQSTAYPVTFNEEAIATITG